MYLSGTPGVVVVVADLLFVPELQAVISNIRTAGKKNPFFMIYDLTCLTIFILYERLQFKDFDNAIQLQTIIQILFFGFSNLSVESYEKFYKFKQYYPN
jgi:hypothetical protein